MILTMIGFGEAAQAMARGFAEETPPPQIRAYDIRLEDDAAAAPLRTVAEETGVTLVADLADARTQLGGDKLSQRLASALRAVEHARQRAVQAGAEGDNGLGPVAGALRATSKPGGSSSTVYSRNNCPLRARTSRRILRKGSLAGVLPRSRITGRLSRATTSKLMPAR